MGFFSRLFGSDPATKVERARKMIEEGRWADARWELEELDHPEAEGLLAQAMAALAALNLEEADARFNAGERESAKEHLEMARQFGATAEQLRDIRKGWRIQRAEEEAARAAEEAKAPEAEGDDPIWSLPPDDPRLRYALRIETWPEELRRRLVDLGPGFAEAVSALDEGKASQAFEAFGHFVARDPVARFERARAALALGRLPAAVSDLLTFGAEVGHRRIGNDDTAIMAAQLLGRLGRADEALELVDAELTQRNDLGLRGTRASLLEAKGSLAEAEDEAFALLEHAGGDLGLVKLLARVRMRRGNRIGAMQALEGGLAKTCNTPGKCGYQPFDVVAGRMLAQLYLEDRLDPKRALQLLDDINHNRQAPEWQDAYLDALQARNQGDPQLPQKLELLGRGLPAGDPRLGLLAQQFSDVPQLTG